MSPKEIDLSLGANNSIAVVAQQQSNGVWLDDSKPLTIHGICKLEKDRLCYCFAQPGKSRPTEFRVQQGSGHTLVRLKRFSTGEADTEKAILDATVIPHKDEIGWIESLQFEKHSYPVTSIILAAKDLKKLRSVSLRDTPMTSGDFEKLANIKSLNKVTLSYNDGLFSGLGSFRPNHPIEELSLHGKAVTNDSIQGLKVPGLKTLLVAQTSLSSTAIGGLLAKHPTLTRLNLEDVHIDEDLASGLKPLKQLEFLDITTAELDKVAIKHIANLQSLTSLLIRGKQISNTELNELTRLEKLTFLRFPGKAISDQSIRLVADSFPNLITMYLYGTRQHLTDDGVKVLLDHPNLHYVNLPWREFDAVVADVNEKLQLRHLERDLHAGK